MFQSYVKIALRNLSKNRLYAVINIMGLAIGLAIFLISVTIARYEQNHDHMFKNRDQIFTVSSIINPMIAQNETESRGVYMAMQPLLEMQLLDIKAARGVKFDFLVKSDTKNFYEKVHFTDPAFLEMFDFEFLQGLVTEPLDPGQVIITASNALKYFGTTDVVGRTLLIASDGQEISLAIKAVIKDLPQDSHFNSSLISNEKLGLITSMKSLEALMDFMKPDTNWDWMSSDYMLYVMTEKGADSVALNKAINKIFMDNHPKGGTPFYTGAITRPLSDANLSIWNAVGIPVITILNYLGVLVLLIAIVNYTNLATAQNLGRFKEVGLRKTLGANKKQLLIQFLIECQTIVFIAMILAVVILELSINPFNSILDKNLTLDYATMVPFVFVTALVVGLIAGAYPAYMITKMTPVDAIKNSAMKGKSGTLFRNSMIGLQFVISIVMFSMMLVVMAQNTKITADSEIFPKSQVMVMGGMSYPKVFDKISTFETELKKIPGVEVVSFSSQIPFALQNWTWSVHRSNEDRSNPIRTNHMMITPDFMKVYDIPMVAGRALDNDISADRIKSGMRVVHAIINEKAVQALGFDSAEAAVGQSVHIGTQENPYQIIIVGVSEDRNILGVRQYVKPFFMRWTDSSYSYASIKLAAGAGSETIQQIEDLWQDLYGNHPLEWSFLDQKFYQQYKILQATGAILTGFSGLSMALALFGLFGLAAFMAQQRTREIGIRKVLGAGLSNIIPMLLINFSRPAIIAFVISMPLSVWIAGFYLQIFPDRINSYIAYIFVAGIISVALSWFTISVHAIRIAKQNPIKALRIE